MFLFVCLTIISKIYNHSPCLWLDEIQSFSCFIRKYSLKGNKRLIASNTARNPAPLVLRGKCSWQVMKVLSSWSLGGKWGSWGSVELSDLLGKLFLGRAVYLGCRTDILMSVAVLRRGWWIGREPKPPPYPSASQATVLEITVKRSGNLGNDTRTVYFTNILNFGEGIYLGYFLFFYLGGDRDFLVVLELSFFVFCKHNIFSL